MTQDEIIEMARDSGMELYGLGKNRARFVYHLEAFANLVATKEREACAKLVDEEALDAYTFDDSLARATEGYARLIRARGEA
jgi:hypothetical protein